ncbi:MAG: hypothetical protein COU70_00790, partial [Parcubacteria group bacterium CG10_big_fil_rev_8_21_14_0_10_35_15]
MTWIFYTLISVVTGSFIGILQKILMKEENSDPLINTIAIQLFGAFVCFIFAFTKGFILPPITVYSLNFALEAILYALVSLFSFKALKLIGASEATIIFSFGSVVAIVASAIFLNEPLTFLRLLGALLIIISLILVAELKNFSINKGALYALLSAVLGGLAVVNDTYLLRYSDAVSYTAIAFLLPGILLLLFYPKSIKRLKTFLKPKPFKHMFFLVLVWSVSAIAFYLAIENGGLISQVFPISQSKIILTVLLAAVLLKEKENLLLKTIASFLTIIGVILI